MASDNPSASTQLPVDVDHVDQLVSIARDMAGLMRILDAAATGDPTLEAVLHIEPHQRASSGIQQLVSQCLAHRSR